MNLTRFTHHRVNVQALGLANNRRSSGPFLYGFYVLTPLLILNKLYVDLCQCIIFSSVSPLRLHNPLLLMERNTRLFYHCCPMCKTPISSALADGDLAPEGTYKICTCLSSNSPQDETACSQEPVGPHERLVFTFQSHQ